MNLNTNGTGNDIFVNTSVSGQVTIRWQATNATNGSQVNFDVVLFSNGGFRFDYGSGNTNVGSAIIGFSAGNSDNYQLAAYTGQSSLTSAASLLYTLLPGYIDIGAYAFLGSDSDNTPPTITATSPSVVGSSAATTTSFQQLQLTLSEPLNPIDADAPAAFKLLGIQGSGNTTYTLVPLYTPGSTTLTLSIVVPGGGNLPLGNYQFTVTGSAVHDLSGLQLAGNGTTAGTNYVRTFSVLSTTQTWTGNGVGNSWSTGGNWSSSFAPLAGDDLVFQGVSQTSTENNLPAGTSLDSITLASPGFVLAGNNITLAPTSVPAVTLAATSGTIQLSITLGSNAAFDVSNAQGSLTDSGAINNGGHTLTFESTSSQASTLSGSISGAGAFIKTGSGKVVLSVPNSFSGGVQVQAGTLVFAAAGALPPGSSLMVGSLPSRGLSLIPTAASAPTATADATDLTPNVAIASSTSAPSGSTPDLSGATIVEASAVIAPAARSAVAESPRPAATFPGAGMATARTAAADSVLATAALKRPAVDLPWAAAFDEQLLQNGSRNKDKPITFAIDAVLARFGE